MLVEIIGMNGWTWVEYPWIGGESFGKEEQLCTFVYIIKIEYGGYWKCCDVGISSGKRLKE